MLQYMSKCFNFFLTIGTDKNIIYMYLHNIHHFNFKECLHSIHSDLLTDYILFSWFACRPVFFYYAILLHQWSKAFNFNKRPASHHNPRPCARNFTGCIFPGSLHGFFFIVMVYLPSTDYHVYYKY